MTLNEINERIEKGVSSRIREIKYLGVLITRKITKINKLIATERKISFEPKNIYDLIHCCEYEKKEITIDKIPYLLIYGTKCFNCTKERYEFYLDTTHLLIAQNKSKKEKIYGDALIVVKKEGKNYENISEPETTEIRKKIKGGVLNYD